VQRYLIYHEVLEASLSLSVVSRRDERSQKDHDLFILDSAPHLTAAKALYLE